MRRGAAAWALLVAGCAGGGVKGSKQDQAPVAREEAQMSGAVSPDGDKHPGEIVHDDKVDGRVWTRKAAEVPVSIAWVKVDGKWKAVTRIEITGSAERREMTKFGAKGEFLETTVAQMSPAGGTPAPSEPTPTPTVK
jgi:hypothetical protein